MDRVLKATHAKGLAPGIHLVHPSDAETKIREFTDAGYRFIALGTDILYLGDSARDLFRVCSSALKGK
jgi:2-keto-3-deoxy-L-rhamnonate aldolase RhmA